MIEREGVLITLGVRLADFFFFGIHREIYDILQEKDGVRSPLLAIWDLGNHDKKTNAPHLLRLIEIQLNNRLHPVLFYSFISL